MSIPKRLLALEIRSSKLGFAILEEPERLLDWGVRSFGEQEGSLKSTALDRIETLLHFHSPFAVVMRDRKYHGLAQVSRIRLIASEMSAVAKRNSAKFYVVSPAEVQKFFAPEGQTTKHDIATNLAKQFEELSWKLPHRRKAYQSESPAMIVFDALATGVAFFGKDSLVNPNSERLQ
jgi:hypothetical protein